MTRSTNLQNRVRARNLIRKIKQDGKEGTPLFHQAVHAYNGWTWRWEQEQKATRARGEKATIEAEIQELTDALR